jgi:hypothetical protein
MVSNKMDPVKNKRLFSILLPGLLACAGLAAMMLLFPARSRAQSAVEFTISPAEGSIPTGSFINFDIAITNTGNISLTNIVIDAHMLLECRRNPLSGYVYIPTYPYYEYKLIELGLNESFTFSCGGKYLSTDIHDTLTLTAEATDGNSVVEDSATVHITAEHLTASFGSEYKPVPYGETAPLALTIFNNGPYTITDITVTPLDSVLTDCTRLSGVLPDLPGGKSLTLNCASANIFADLETVVEIQGILDGYGIDIAEVAYIQLDSIDGLSLDISPDFHQITPGSNTNMTVTLHNRDNIPVTGLTVSAPGLPRCDKPVGSLPDLQGGERHEYSCLSPQLDTINVFTMTAAGTVNQLPVTAVANTTINAASEIAVTVSPDYLIMGENNPVTLTITLANNHISETLTTPALVISPAFPDQPGAAPAGYSPGCGRPAGTLPDMAPGAVISYTCLSQAFPGQPVQEIIFSGFYPAQYEDGDGNYHIAAAETYLGLSHSYLPVFFHNYRPPFTGPDLVIGEMTLHRISNDVFNINIRARNQSTLPVDPGNNFYVNAYLTSNLNKPIFVCSVQGEWFSAEQDYLCSGQVTLPAGSYTVRAWADPYNTVTEHAEVNNTYDLEVTNE